MFSDQVAVFKIKTTNVDATFIDCSTVPTVQRTHFRLGICGTGESLRKFTSSFRAIFKKHIVSELSKQNSPIFKKKKEKKK